MEFKNVYSIFENKVKELNAFQLNSRNVIKILKIAIEVVEFLDNDISGKEKKNLVIQMIKKYIQDDNEISDVEKRNVNQGKNQAAMYNQITDLKKDIQKLRKELEASKLQSFRDIDRLNENIARNKNSQLEKLRLIVDQIKLLGATTGVNIDRRVRF